MLIPNRTNQVKYFLFISIFLLIVFILAVVVWYSPVLFKGYSAYIISTNTVLSQNLYQTGFYSIENDLNVFLSPNLIESQGHISAYGNKLTSLIYAQIFKITGLPQVSDFILLSIFIHALTLLIFTGVVFYLFDFKKALVFSLIYIVLPFNWTLPYKLASYEFTLLFLALFFLFYFYGIKQKKYNYFYLIISGIFLGLACLAKEATLLIAPFLFIFLLLKKQKRYLIYIFIPFSILLAIFWLPNFSYNTNLNLFTTQTSKELKSADYSFYGHIYPDPYTYHFERDEFINQLKNSMESGEFIIAKQLGKIKMLKNMGIREISLVERISIGLMLGARHIFRFFSLEDIGGPFIFLLILLGVYRLRQKNKSLYQLLVYWIALSVFLFTFIILVVRNHLMDFNWAIALFITLGIFYLANIIVDHFNLKKMKTIFIYLIILFAVLYNFVLVNHVAWSRVYNNSNNLLIEAYMEKVKKMNVDDNKVIAVNLSPNSALNLNYLTNKSIIVFVPESIEKLLEKNELSFIFDKFGVKYVLGYSDQLTEDILNQTETINVSNNLLKPVIPEISRNKGWLMNLIN